jgi:predicted RNA-binding Zn-ribbon protein involved in translation (DUF1610 family)
MSEGAEFGFVCPECGESLEVNGSMRDALVENGCVICGAAVSQDSFTYTSPR